ncbi:hypothetical protein PYCCODRAFT_1404746 [Trametes coccinea BRFM310]|uniref:PalH-domain-containing protein n=1 Tax=Trametes coccinea (strain BRFM310) TaxID=1353009 RepID=A0A1Y2IXR4_TRAC3|nr:hypothetical protein PYCCODRAFT_1404746 [Trametes coccinea BRFM310]
MQWLSVSRFPVVAGVKLFWERVTFSRLTKIYFAFSVLHCIVQVIFQVQAFFANAQAASFLYGLVKQGNATDPGFAVYDVDLRMCETVPRTVDASSCPVVWDGHTKGNMTLVTGQNDAAVSTVLSSVLSSSSSASAVATALSSSPASITSSSSVVTASVNATLSTAASTANATSGVSSSSGRSASSSSAHAVSATSSRSGTTITLTESASHTVVSSTLTKDATVTVTLRVASPTASAKPGHDDDSDDEDESDDDDDEDDDEEEEEDDDEDEDDAHVRFFDVVQERNTKVTSYGSFRLEETHRDGQVHARRSSVLKETQIRLALNGTAMVNLNGLDGHFEVELPRKCLYTLNWPVDIVENTKREDIAFIAFQVWLLGMSLVALLNESIPHVVASLLTHILATAWGGFQIFNTESFHRKFTTLTTNGACGVNLLPTYWKTRSNAEIPSLALNCFALLVSAFLSWRLIKSFGWQTFKRVGASRVINRVYNLVLMLSIAIQLALFFVGASAALWLDQVYNGNIGRLTMKPTFFKAVMITVLVLLIPWLSTGWISVRKELRIPMTVFLGVAGFVLVGWASMFIAATFRWTYVTWLFFSLMTTAAVLLIVITLILGIVCRINFGKGLTRYLNAQEELGEDDYQTPGEKADSEKVAFPSTDLPIPTYSVAFGGGSSGQDVPPPSQMRFAPRQMGPRFYTSTQSSASNPFSTPSPTDGSGSVLSRQDSRSSQHSQTSVRSAGSNASSSAGSARGKRWVIE